MGFTRSRRLTRFAVHMQAFGRALRRPHSVTAYTANTASAYERGYAAAAPDDNASAVENAGTRVTSRARRQGAGSSVARGRRMVGTLRIVNPRLAQSVLRKMQSL